MKIECVKKNIQDGVFITEKAIGRNLTLPVLGCILVQAQKDKVLLRSTNLELGLEVVIPARVLEEGEVAVPGQIFHSVLQNLPDTKLELSVREKNVYITTSKSNTIIKSFESEDFPILPKSSNTTNQFILPVDILLKGLQSVAQSASLSTVKPELASVYMYQYDKKLFFVATDSFRLSEKIIPVKNVQNFEPILLPIRNVIDIIKILEYLKGEEIKLILNETQISFETDTIYLTSRLIDGSFPDYRQIIPKKETTEVVVLKHELQIILKKINIFSDKFNQVHIIIDPKKKRVTISSHNSDVGETIETIDGTIKGDAVDMKFNHKYIADALSVIQSDSISLSFNGLGKPLVMRGISDTSYLYLVMPMNR